MANFVSIPFNPNADPFTIAGRALAPAAQAFGRGIVQPLEDRAKNDDIAAIKQWVDSGMEGAPPSARTSFGQEITGTLILRQANEEIADPAGKTLRLTRRNLTRENRLRRAQTQQIITETDQLGLPTARKFGVTPWYLSPENRNTPEGKAALAKSLEGSTDLEALRFWLGIKDTSGGPFFHEGLEGAAQEAKDPELFEFASEELSKVQKRLEKAGTVLPDAIRAPRNIGNEFDLQGMPIIRTTEQYEQLKIGDKWVDVAGRLREKVAPRGGVR